MKKHIIKTTILSVSAVLLLSACSTNQERVGSSAIASDASASEIKAHEKYTEHVKKAKKRNKRVKLKKKEDTTTNTFCFKDNHSIHYRVEERCK